MALNFPEKYGVMNKKFSFTSYLSLFFITLFLNPSGAAAQDNAVSLGWLDEEAPPVSTGVSWGVPWPSGKIEKDEVFTLIGEDGQNLPLQSWPMAYWPDGSIKWMGFATATDSENDSFRLIQGQGDPEVPDEASVKVRESDTTYEIDTGPLQVRITKWGGALIRSMSIDGREIAREGKLIALVENGSEDYWSAPQREKYISKVEKVTVEQEGPVRAVIKVEGVHKAEQNGGTLLPFVVRLYFYGGNEAVRMVHSFIYDGGDDRDFIRGLGIHFSIPMREQVQNRHVRFSGAENGLWSEPIQPMIGRGGRYVADPETGEDVYPDQIAGKRVPDRQEISEQGQNFLADWAVWNDFRLMQPNADGFTIQKKTNSQSAWIPAGAGDRASGLVFVGDVSGGLGVSLKDFWQSYPSGLEVRNAGSSAADLYVWLWSPDAPVMDMRHYDTKPHGLESVYEDVQQGFSDPYGVARTSELTLFPTANVPSKEETVRMAKTGSQPPLLTASPEYLHSVGIFGYWSLPDRSTPFKKAIENRLDSYIDYYKKAIEQHKWYGFWDYGDVMHSYDNERHVWRYDLGGMAWQNTELMSDMWLWYSFLRTGRADIFRMAEAMTRHTQEVDVYHIGRFAGLGTRHNVRHWGGGAKEVRISQAALKRFYYYLTTDERTGYLIHEVVTNAVDAITRYDPMRLADPATEEEKKYPARLRLGPDWLALAGNWMAEWERAGDTEWRDLLYAGFDSISKFPLGFRTGENLVVGMDPETGKLYQLSDEAGEYNLSTIQGGGEVGIELAELVDHKGWKEEWLRYCRLYYAPKEVYLKDMKAGPEGTDGSYTRPDRLAAYAYMKTGNPAFAEQALKQLTGRRGTAALDTEMVKGPLVLNPVIEAGEVNTNNAAQWSLNAIEILEMCADRLPEEMPEAE